MTLDGWGALLIGLSPFVAMAVVLWDTQNIRSGRMVRIETKQLYESSQDQIRLLEDQVTTLRRERENEKKELLEALRASTRAEFAVSSFLDRYESLGGMVGAERLRPHPGEGEQ